MILLLESISYFRIIKRFARTLERSWTDLKRNDQLHDRTITYVLQTRSQTFADKATHDSIDIRIVLVISPYIIIV